MCNFTKMCLWLALCFSWTMGYGQDDTAVPQITDIRFSNQTVNVTNGDVTVSLFIDITDNLSGAKNVLPDLIYPNGKRENCVASLVSGTTTNGTWRYDFSIPRHMPAGIARMDLYLTDEAMNHTFFTSDQLRNSNFDPDFLIIDSNPDNTPPGIVDISLSSQTVDITNGDGMITIQMDITDNLSGTGVVFPNLVLPNGMEINGNAQLISGSVTNGRWEKTFVIPQHTETGMAQFGLFLEDGVYNGVTFNPAGVASGGFDNDFMITGGVADNAAPEILSFAVSTENVNVENSSALVAVLIRATDNLSGVRQVIPHLNTPNGDISSNGATLISGTEADGLWRYTFTIPQYTSAGMGTFNISVKDHVNNCADLTFAELDNMGYVADFEINASSLPISLVNFSAENQSDQILLNWKVVTATEDFGFQVEHSTDGSSFRKIGEVGGGKISASIQHFEFIHLQPANGRNYYRLQQIETTGTSKYSTIVNVLLEEQIAYVYPNPTSGSINVDQTADFVEILNLAGQSLLKFHQIGSDLDLSILPNGTYLVNTWRNGAAQTERIVKR
ncbi:MAG: T9SS type A sorting domain-containing protein [Saprospiraceae bacterium]